MRIDPSSSLPSTASRVLLAAMLGLGLGCPGGDDSPSDTEASATGDTEVGTTTNNPPSTDTDPVSDDTTTSGPPPATDSGSTGPGATDSSGTGPGTDSGTTSEGESGSESSGTTGEALPCEVMLPPPASVTTRVGGCRFGSNAPARSCWQRTHRTQSRTGR